MQQFIVWYLVISLLGLAIFPITRRLFNKGAVQGFFYSKVIALFVWGFLYWFLGSIKIIPVDLNGALLVLAGMIASAFFISKKSFREEYVEPLREHKTAVITGEVIFLLAFLFMAFLKSMYPNLDHTEKPMDMAFINGILRSTNFPPGDPWLSGYGISYYYFGYVIVSLLIRVTGVDSAIGFNLAISLWYGLSAQAIYGIVYQLLSDWRKRTRPLEEAIRWSERKGTIYALIAPVLALFSGNFEGLLEVLYARGLFWKTQADGNAISNFWKWLDITDLKSAPINPVNWVPNRSSWWWWQASRVLQDYDIQGVGKEIIDEFPYFSYYLGDLHPHVLAMPFVLVAVALCYAFFIRIKNFQPSENGLADLREIFAEPAMRWSVLFTLVFIGGIAFLNTWDFPVYFGLFMLIILLWRINGLGWSSRRLLEAFVYGLVGGLISLLCYIPFFISFSSQAGGILPSMVFFTTGKQLWIFFGGLLVPIIIWLLWLSSQHSNPLLRMKSLLVSLAGWIGVGLFAMLIAILGLSTVNLFLSDSEFLNLGARIYNAQGNGGTVDILIETIIRRISSPFGWLSLVFMLGLIISLFIKRDSDNDPKPLLFTNETSFVVLVLALGIGLIAFPEFFYLLDNFGWRMNTIFKFYYQVWLLLSVCASFAMIVALDQLRGMRQKIAGVSIILVMCVVLIYPSMATYYRFIVDHNPTMSLDGMYHIRSYNPMEAEAIDWLKQAPSGVLVEAVGGSYRSDFGKVSAHTGLQTILGWPGHEGQWRGGYDEIGNREEDVRRIYQLRNWPDVKTLLDQYQVRYIYIGMVEGYTYNIEAAKFQSHLKVVYQNDSVVIYEYLPETMLVEETLN